MQVQHGRSGELRRSVSNDSSGNRALTAGSPRQSRATPGNDSTERLASARVGRDRRCGSDLAASADPAPRRCRSLSALTSKQHRRSLRACRVVSWFCRCRDSARASYRASDLVSCRVSAHGPNNSDDACRGRFGCRHSGRSAPAASRLSALAVSAAIGVGVG
jgi:hypothetical protein